VIVTVVGAPGAGKGALAANLKAAGVAVFSDPGRPYGLPFGSQADYRTELWAAANRALTGDEIGDEAVVAAVRTHSLLDSLAHVAANGGRATENPGLPPETKLRWLMTATVVEQMLRDSRPGPIVYAPVGGTATPFELEVDGAIRVILEETEHVTLEAAPDTEAAAAQVVALLG
jgi:hypothetical protein